MYLTPFPSPKAKGLTIPEAQGKRQNCGPCAVDQRLGSDPNVTYFIIAAYYSYFRKQKPRRTGALV